VSFEFLSTAGSALARSPMERQARAAGAVIAARDGWNVAVRFDGDEAERERCRTAVGFADMCHLAKIEVQGDLAAILASGPPELGTARRSDGAWICPYHARRALVICEPGAAVPLRERLEEAAGAAGELASVIDLTSAVGGVVLAGPLARETFARFTAIDLRPKLTPVHAFRPGSVARGPGAILREAEERYLMLFGAALGSYMWTVVADAAGSLGGGPVGVDVLDPIQAEVPAHA